MNKRTFRIMTLALLVVVCMFATTMLTACHKEDAYYLSAKSTEWATYSKVDEIADDVLFAQGDDGYYSLTVDLEAGDSFAIYNVGSEENLVKSIFSTLDALTLSDDGKVAVNESGNFVLVLDLESGELTYTFTPDEDLTPEHECLSKCDICGKCNDLDCQEDACADKCEGHDEPVPEHQCSSKCDTCKKCKDTSCNEDACVEKCTGHSTPEPAHKCESKCKTCGKCTDLACKEDACKDKCQGHEPPHQCSNKCNICGKCKDDACNKDACLNKCGGHSPDDPIIDVVEIYFAEVEIELTVGDAQTLTVYVYPDNATNKTYTVEVEGDSGVISYVITSSGLKITALKAGEVSVVVKSASDDSIVSDPLTVIVKDVTLTEIQLESSYQFDNVGDTHRLVTALVPANAFATLTWTSNNEAVATVSSDGTVTAVGAGSATITVTDLATGIQAQCIVTVRQAVTSLTLSASSLIVYTGAGASARELTVTINPSDATNKNFKVTVTQSGSYISYTTSGTTISIKGLAVGTAILTVTSEDNTSAKATCTIEVKDVSDAVPYLAVDNISVNLNGVSETIEVKSDSATITSVSYSVASTAVASVTTLTNSGTYTFRVNGLKLGSTTVTVTVVAGGSTTTLKLNVLVTDDYFYLTGNFDGTSWTTYASESDARMANVLLENNGDGTFSITRDFAANEMFYILPATLDTDWTLALYKNSYVAQSNGSTYGVDNINNKDNVILTYAGNYTVKLDLTGTSASWTIIVNYIAPASANIASNTTILTEGSGATANLTLTVLPTLSEIDASNITWTVDSQYSNWLKLVPGGDAKTCAVSLVDFQGSEQVHVTITATVKLGNFTVSSMFTLTLMPEGSSETPVTEVTFDDTSYALAVDENGWSITISAHVNSSASVQGVTYSLIGGADTVLYNNVSGNYAFSINANTGKLTAKQFGTIKVRATSVGTNDSGSNVYADIDVTIYSKTLMLSGSYGSMTDSDWSNNTTAWTTSPSIYQYVWSDITLYSGDSIIVLYSTSDWDNGAIRNASVYLDSASTSGAVGSSGSSISNYCFTIKTDGVYTITVDLSGSKPAVKFVKTADIVQQDTWSTTISDVAIVSTGNTWGSGVEYFARAQNQTVTNTNPYVVLTLDCTTSSTLNMTNPQIGFIIGGSWYSSTTSELTITGDNVSSSWTTGKWQKYNDQLQYVGNPHTDGVSLTFTFEFNQNGKIVSIVVK